MSNTPKKRRPKPKRPPLTAREIAFATHYFEHGVASDAYKAAGYPQRPNESVWTLSARVLRKPAVQVLIHDLRDQACETAMVTAARIVRALARAAFADRRGLYDERGNLKLPHQWPDDVGDTVEAADSEQVFEWVTETDPETKKKVKKKVLRGYTVKVKTSRRVEALKLLAQYRGVIKDAQSEIFEAEIAALRRQLEQLRDNGGQDANGTPPGA